MSEENQVFMLSPTSRAENSLEDDSQEGSPKPIDRNLSDDEVGLVKSKKKRRQHLSDSESDLDKEIKEKQESKSDETISGDKNSFTNSTRKSRIKCNGTDSDSDINPSENVSEQKKYESIRTEDKKKKLKDKFNGLISSKKKTELHSDEKLSMSENESSKSSDEEVSCLTIKQKIKKSAYSMKSICDPDTSDDESNTKMNHHQRTKLQKPKSTKLTSPKPIRMSAKQAMENMHKIKSESNRMLREKQVSLPYHRPKALSLKDIMSRRKPAVASDGKALPIKMNSEQLKQYALLLEQRQKEVIELCKSDTEDEEDCPKEVINNKNDMPVDTTNNDVTEPSLEYTEISQSVKGSNVDETSCIECNTQENILTYCQHKLEKQADIAMEIDTLNESVNIDSHKEDSENYLNNRNEINEKEIIEMEESSEKQSINVSEQNSEQESQIMELHYDSERVELIQENEQNITKENILEADENRTEEQHTEVQQSDDQDSIENDIDYDEISRLIDNAELITDEVIKNKEIDEKISFSKNAAILPNPKLTGGPGMVIDLDNSDLLTPKQLTGVDLLKERFSYFAKLNSLKDMEKDREKKFKPGTQHLKLKQELEQQIAEQRSLEWEKRLKEENRLKSEINGQFSDEDIEKLEAKLDITENPDDEKVNSESSESEEEPIENDIILEDKPRKRNPMVDDEAEESECDEEIRGDDNNEINDKADDGEDADLEDEGDDDETSESSSESEEEVDNKPKKGRILKAFEDSDDEAAVAESNTQNRHLNYELIDNKVNVDYDKNNGAIKDTQDDELQLAQVNKSSDDLHSSRESPKSNLIISVLNKNSEENTSGDLGTQTFSILNSAGPNRNLMLNTPEKLSASGTQNDVNLNVLVGISQQFTHKLLTDENTPPPLAQTQELGDDVIALCTGKFYDNPFLSEEYKINSSSILKLSENSQSQEIGDDIVALCTGKFYDNPFVSQCGENSDVNRQETLKIIDNPKEDVMNVENEQTDNSIHKNHQNDYHSTITLTDDFQSQEIGDDIAALCTGKFYDNPFVSQYDTNSEINKREILKTAEKPKDGIVMNVENKQIEKSNNDENLSNSKNDDKAILNSILEELDGPDFGEPKNKYFVDKQTRDKTVVQNSLLRKKLVIDSDDEMGDNLQKKNKRLKKRKAEQRALQFSDDDEEEEEELAEDHNDAESDIDEDDGRIVEYDSEENEVEVQQKTSKMKRVGAFFENEAELTSEDEWVGSGDEDERGLDRMEREEGDDDTFHQGQLQRELGQIHMREVLDQDKREVRMLQELLFEDGDLGDGHRQRKFRWKNADGEEEIGTNPDEFIDTQEEEFESEEQWRKQRHERETFLRKLQEKDEEDVDSNINKTAIIKANLCSRSVSMLLSENNSGKTEKEDTIVLEKKSAKDIPSPKKPFTIFQQNYHGSLLTRGRGALARLAALATPLATDNDDAPKLVTTANRRNFVFTALSQDAPKVTKRKAESNVNTPRLIKKMKTDDANKHYKNSLFNHLKS